VLDLKTGQPITSKFVKEIPIAKEVILQVEQLAKKHGFRPHAEPIFRSMLCSQEWRTTTTTTLKKIV